MFSACYHVCSCYLCKPYEIGQECSNLTIISLLVRPRPQSDQAWMQWEIELLSFAMKNAQAVFSEELLIIWA